MGPVETRVRELVEESEEGSSGYSVEDLVNPTKTFGTRFSKGEARQMRLIRANTLALLEIAREMDRRTD